MNAELYHSGRKGMKWYQHIFGEEAQQRRRAKRMKKNADKVAKIKEKIRIAEEANKLKQMKADAKKKLKETKGESSKIKKLKKEDMKKQIEETKAASEKTKKTTALFSPQTSARAIARSMGGMSDEEVRQHVARLKNENSIRQYAAEEADRAQNPVKKYIKETLKSAAGNAVNSLVSYGTKKASDAIIGAIESRLAGAKPQPDSDRVNAQKRAQEAQKTSNAMKQYGFKSDSNKSWYNYDISDGEKTTNAVDRIIDLTSAISGNKNTGTAVKAVVDAVKTIPVNEVKQMFALPPPTAKSERERPSVIYL